MAFFLTATVYCAGKSGKISIHTWLSDIFLGHLCRYEFLCLFPDHRRSDALLTHPLPARRHGGLSQVCQPLCERAALLLFSSDRTLLLSAVKIPNNLRSDYSFSLPFDCLGAELCYAVYLRCFSPHSSPLLLLLAFDQAPDLGMAEKGRVLGCW